MDRAVKTLTHIPQWLPKSFGKKDGAPDIQFEGYSATSSSRWITTSSPTPASSATPSARPPRRARRRSAATPSTSPRRSQALAAVEVTIKNREFIDRV